MTLAQNPDPRLKSSRLNRISGYGRAIGVEVSDSDYDEKAHSRGRR